MVMAMMDTPVVTRRVVFYERVSSEDQRERATIAMQVSALDARLAAEPGASLVERRTTRCRRRPSRVDSAPIPRMTTSRRMSKPPAHVPRTQNRSPSRARPPGPTRTRDWYDAQ